MSTSSTRDVNKCPAIANAASLPAICMNRLLGYSLMGTGILGFVFFLNYKGTTIPVKEPWFVLSFFTIAVGAYILIKHALHEKGNQNTEHNWFARIDQLKRIGDKIRITLDNAEVKTISHHQEVLNDRLPSRMEMLDALYDKSRNYKTEEIQQTYLTFHKQYGSKTYKFVSHATLQNADTVKRYIDNQNGIDLYIDSNNPSNYYFDLPFM